MADFFRFETNSGPVLLDLELVCAVWAGKEPGTTVMELVSMEPVVVNIDFEEYVNDWMDHTDPRPKKKPRKTKVKRGSVAKVVALKS